MSFHNADKRATNSSDRPLSRAYVRTGFIGGSGVAVCVGDGVGEGVGVIVGTGVRVGVGDGVGSGVGVFVGVKVGVLV